MLSGAGRCLRSSSADVMMATAIAWIRLGPNLPQNCGRSPSKLQGPALDMHHHAMGACKITDTLKLGLFSGRPQNRLCSHCKLCSQSRRDTHATRSENAADINGLVGQSGYAICSSRARSIGNRRRKSSLNGRVGGPEPEGLAEKGPAIGPFRLGRCSRTFDERVFRNLENGSATAAMRAPVSTPQRRGRLTAQLRLDFR